MIKHSSTIHRNKLETTDGVYHDERGRLYEPIYFCGEPFVGDEHIVDARRL